jgi:hypothetical protein
LCEARLQSGSCGRVMPLLVTVTDMDSCPGGIVLRESTAPLCCRCSSRCHTFRFRPQGQSRGAADGWAIDIHIQMLQNLCLWLPLRPGTHSKRAYKQTHGRAEFAGKGGWIATIHSKRCTICAGFEWQSISTKTNPPKAGDWIVAVLRTGARQHTRPRPLSFLDLQLHLHLSPPSDSPARRALISLSVKKPFK